VKFPVPETWEEFCKFKVGLRRCVEAEKKRQARRKAAGKEPLPEHPMPVIKEPKGPRPANLRQMMAEATMGAEELWQYVDEELLSPPEVPSASEMPLAEEGLDLLLGVALASPRLPEQQQS
jgi:hypothetical protein